MSSVSSKLNLLAKLVILNHTKQQAQTNYLPGCLKNAPSSLHPSLSIYSQNLLPLATLPTTGVLQKVSLVYKKDDKEDPANYRPISLTSISSKILEHIDRLQSNYATSGTAWPAFQRTTWFS